MAGQPTAFKAEYAEQAKKLCEQFSSTDDELADFFEVSVRTIYRWKAKHGEFCHALKAGKDVADDRIERSLSQRCLGIRVPAIRVFMPAGAKKPIVHEYEEYIPPETKAMMFWLCNRRPDIWKFRPEYLPDETTPIPEAIEVTIVDNRKPQPE